MHLRHAEIKYLMYLCTGGKYHVSASTKTMGVMLGFSERMQWKAFRIIKHKEGRYIILHGSLWDIDYNFRHLHAKVIWLHFGLRYLRTCKI